MHTLQSLKPAILPPLDELVVDWSARDVHLAPAHRLRTFIERANLNRTSVDELLFNFFAYYARQRCGMRFDIFTGLAKACSAQTLMQNIGEVTATSHGDTFVHEFPNALAPDPLHKVSNIMRSVRRPVWHMFQLHCEKMTRLHELDALIGRVIVLVNY